MALAQAGRIGAPLDLIGGTNEEGLRDPTRAEHWPPTRQLPAETLRQAILDLARDEDRVDPRGLHVRGAHILGSLDLAHVRVPVPIQLTACRFDGPVDFDGAHFEYLRLAESAFGTDQESEPSSCGLLSMNLATINTDLDLRGLTVHGTLRLYSAQIDGSVFLTGARVHGAKEPVLILDGTRIGQSLYLRRIHVAGQTRIAHARIGGQVTLAGATLDAGQGRALVLDGTSIGQSLFLRGLQSMAGDLSLVSARIDNLVVAQEAERPRTGEPEPVRQATVSANGVAIRDVHGWLRTNRRAAAEWLDRRADGTPFSPQPWHEFAAVYERNGRPENARWMRYQAARRTARGTSPLTRAALRAYQLLVGFGYYPLITIVWLAALWLAAFWITGTYQQAFVPIDANVAEQLPVQPALYALETVVPPAAAVQSTPWEPTGWIVWWLTGFKALGWVLTALLLAGVTGLLRKT